jgi:hypothetical protein
VKTSLYLGVIFAISAILVAAAPSLAGTGNKALSGVASSGGATYSDDVSDDVLTDSIFDRREETALDAQAETQRETIEAKRSSAGNWKRVLAEDGAECEGLVFESAKDAEEVALKMGCSGYHEHSIEDRTVLYMPCAFDVRNIKTEILDALAEGQITEEQFSEKLEWLIQETQAQMLDALARGDITQEQFNEKLDWVRS